MYNDEKRKKVDFDENYFLGNYDSSIKKEKKHFVLVIYDISNNKRRNKIVKLLKSYGFRVQKSAFEILVDPIKYNKLVEQLSKIPDKDDSIRVYKIQSKGAVEVFGSQFYIENEDTIVI